VKKVLFLSCLISISSCKKDLAGTGYDELIGKWKLVYTLRFTTTTYEKLTPADNFKIEFNERGKMCAFKNEHRESKEKVEDCVVTFDSPPSQYKRVYMHIKKGAYSLNMEFPHYPQGYDTLIMDGYFPYENDPNHNPYYYAHYYVKE
jgi:hypothetical protein